MYMENNSTRDQKQSKGLSLQEEGCPSCVALCFEVTRHSKKFQAVKPEISYSRPCSISLCDSQCFIPSKVEGLVQKDGELIGRLHYKEGHDLYHWRVGWFLLGGSALHFSSGEEDGEGEVLQLKQLQELSKHAACLHYLHLMCEKCRCPAKT